jgi:long-subunit fatty acid transport protein
LRSAALLVSALAAAAPARADGLDLPLGARALARAGANLVADDGIAALYGNPAALARRTSFRLELGLTLADRAASFTTAAAFATPPPAVASAGEVALLPSGGAALGVSDRVVVAAAFLSPTAVALDYPGVDTAYDPMHDDRAATPQRYAATRLHLGRTAVAAGAAARLLPWLAVGASGLALRTSLEAGRVLWAGPPGSTIALGGLSPAYDMAFAADGTAWSPAAGAGLVAAPPDLPFELGASLLWQGGVTITGAPALRPSRGAGAGGPDVAAAVAADASARLDLPARITVRAGARLLLGRATVEVDAERTAVDAATPAWSLSGVAAVPAGGAPTPLTTVPLGPTLDSSLSVRGAVDVVLAPGALVLVVGYAFSSRPFTATSIGPALPADDTHTLALGVEGRVDGATVTLGLAHLFVGDRVAQTGDARVLDPFGPIDVPAGAGRVGSGATVVALDLELELL